MPAAKYTSVEFTKSLHCRGYRHRSAVSTPMTTAGPVDHQTSVTLLTGNLRNRRSRYRRLGVGEAIVMTMYQPTRRTIGWRPVHVSEMKYLDLHGERVAYREAGAGEVGLTPFGGHRVRRLVPSE